MIFGVGTCVGPEMHGRRGFRSISHSHLKMMSGLWEGQPSLLFLLIIWLTKLCLLRSHIEPAKQSSQLMSSVRSNASTTIEAGQ